MSSLNVNDIYDAGGVFKKQQVVQVVNIKDGNLATGTTIMVSDDSIPQNTEGTEFISLSIIPKSTTNLLKIDVSVSIAHTNNNDVIAALFQDDIVDALAASLVQSSVNNADNFITFSYYMIAATISSTTFKVRCGGSVSGTTTFNGTSSTRRMGGVMASSITITEFQPS